MEIIKYRKIKDNLYELDLDNGTTLKFFDDTIIKYSLLLKKIISNKELEEITNYNNKLAAYYYALKYLNRKMRSKLEIEKYLLKADYDKESISETLIKLEEEGYLNDQKYINSYINDQIHLTSNGPEKIKHNLIKLGFNENEININYDFNDKIQTLINKKLKLNRKYNTWTIKSNITNYLINLGYPKELFIEYLEDVKVDDQNLIKKDYELLLKKYQRKYDNKKLKLFIKDKLYKKGYNIEEISVVINDEY